MSDEQLQETDELSQEEILAQGEDELDSSLEAAENADEDDGTLQEEGETETADGSQETAEDEEQETAESDEDSETDPDAEPVDDADKSGKRITDLQAGFTKASQQSSAMRQKLISRIEKDLGGFEALSSEEYQSLREEDPDAALDYLEEVEEKQAQLAEKEALEQEEMEEQEHVARAEVAQTVVDVAVELGMDANDKKSIGAFFNSEELIAATQVLADPDYGFQRGKNGLYSKKQLLAAYKLANMDQVKGEAQADGYESAITNINRAAKSGSKLSKVAPKGPKFTTPKKRSQEEILALGEEEVNQELERAENANPS
jgi:hypothetical protein